MYFNYHTDTFTQGMSVVERNNCVNYKKLKITKKGLSCRLPNGYKLGVSIKTPVKSKIDSYLK